MNVERMLRTNSAKQFFGWLAYSEIEPFGELRDDYRAASIREMIYNTSVVKKEDRRPLEDFLLPFGEKTVTKPVQTPEFQISILTAIAAGWSGRGKDV